MEYISEIAALIMDGYFWNSTSRSHSGWIFLKQWRCEGHEKYQHDRKISAFFYASPYLPADSAPFDAMIFERYVAYRSLLTLSIHERIWELPFICCCLYLAPDLFSTPWFQISCRVMFWKQSRRCSCWTMRSDRSFGYCDVSLSLILLSHLERI